MRVNIEEYNIGQWVIEKGGDVKMFFLEYYLHKICEKLINYSWTRLYKKDVKKTLTIPIYDD